MDLHISLTNRNVSRDIYRQIRDAILDDRLRPGAMLPSTRELAQRLSVSRNTIVTIYERLRAEGFVQSRKGAGTYVAKGLRSRIQVGARTTPLQPQHVWAGIPDGIDLSATRAEFDLRPGIPDTSRFPFAEWRARLSRQLRPRAVGNGALIGPAGHPLLRAAIARHVAVSRAVRATASDVIVTNGSQQALDIVARVLLAPGDTVVIEDPGYVLPRRLFQSHNLRVVGVPVDDEGLIVEMIPHKTRLVYVTPSHQYPLGMPMSMDRRQALLNWAERTNAAIVEDDYDSEFRYGGRPFDSLQGLDDSSRVIYLGSFSKSLMPTLRLGFLIAAEPLHTALRKAKQLTDWHTALADQVALAELIEDGLLAQHIRRMRRIYASRHERIVQLLQRDFLQYLTPLTSAGGLHLTAFCTNNIAGFDSEIAQAALARDLAILPLSYHYLNREPRCGLLFGYGNIELSRIDDAMRALLKVFTSAPQPTAASPDPSLPRTVVPRAFRQQKPGAIR